jgi:hypothetical protein
MGLKVVSFSLYGTAPRYLQGAVENAKRMSHTYPDWKMWIYAADDVDTTELEDLGCFIKRMGQSLDCSGMVWRFLSAWEPEVEYSIFRDADSRINPREQAAVRDWLASGKLAHCMADHQHHRCMPINGGMFGIKGGVLPGKLDSSWCLGKTLLTRPKAGDMPLLEKLVWPLIKDSVCHHSSVPLKWPYEPFPLHKPWPGFIGQQYDDAGNAVWV